MPHTHSWNFLRVRSRSFGCRSSAVIVCTLTTPYYVYDCTVRFLFRLELDKTVMLSSPRKLPGGEFFPADLQHFSSACLKFA